LTNLKQERGNQTRVCNSDHKENRMSGFKTLLAVAVAAVSMSACSTLGGAALGGAAGAAIGNNTGDGDAGRGAAIGAAAGAIAGTVADDDR
jgi:osmotically inducible lipoprotein OsmB